MRYLVQLVYIHEGHEDTFDRFEAIVLPLLVKYRGELLLRLRPSPESKLDGSSESPHEIHVVRFASDDDLAAYTNDEERRRVLPLKEQSVRDTLLIRGSAV